jgi:hypothetical protein
MNDEVAMFLKKTQHNKDLSRDPRKRSPAVNSDASFGGQNYNTNELHEQRDFED